jgi:hypothetical protein
MIFQSIFNDNRDILYVLFEIEIEDNPVRRRRINPPGTTGAPANHRPSSARQVNPTYTKKGKKILTTSIILV